MSTLDPDFWDRHFGIKTKAEFDATFKQYALSVGPKYVKAGPDAFLYDAYYFPADPPGAYIAAIAYILEAVGVDVPASKPAIAHAAAVAREQEEQRVAPLVIPNVYRVAIQGISGGQDVVNVVGVRGSASGQHAGAAAAVRTAWKVASGPMSRMSSAYTLSSVKAMDLSSLDGGIAEVTDGSFGSGSGTLATNAASALVKWNGGTRSGSSRGRLYFGPLPELSVNSDGRTLASSEITALQTAFQNFINSLSGAGFPLCVISRTLGNAATVTSLSIESVIATQRRRIRD